MTDPHAAIAWPDRACQSNVEIIENVPLARDTYRVRFAAPEIARRIVPGQFLMVKIAGQDDPLLGRPLALYDIVVDQGGHPFAIDIVYLVLGRMTQRLARCRPGQRLDVWGPLGNGFPPRRVPHLVMVAGGIGQTPFLAMAREAKGQRLYGAPPRATAAADRITLCYGARSAPYFAGLDDFTSTGCEVRLSTDDGTRGLHGRVTDLLAPILDSEPAHELHVVTCGPEPMMAAVAKLTREAGVSCEVSLETPMACGLGICFSCVARVKTESGDWDYRRTCIEGPVFAADAIEW